MKLRPIDQSGASAAAALLSVGFPSLSHSEWADTVQKLLDYAAGRGHGVIGQIAQLKGQDIGICLMIPSAPVTPDAEFGMRINVAAFYLAPGHEWMTTLFMRRLMADCDTEYTDLTASSSMRDINRRLGFFNHSEGMIIVATPMASMQPAASGIRLLSLKEAETETASLSVNEWQVLRDHHHFGCAAFVVVEHGRAYPLILAPSSRKGIPGARVLLARDRALLRSVLGVLSRSMVLAGKTYIEFDGAEADMPAGALFLPSAAPVQSTRQEVVMVIDHTYSEFAFIPPTRLRAAVRIYENRIRTEACKLSLQATSAAISHPATCLALKVAEISGL
ncbi:hypothetical protein MUU53_15165 [Rhizobium lemnae]|uniref:GNAT family N-acetyltransferase n=1 Tax=Rhizobium lemnae TaxID=1214924 RepID=A0ABV8EC10_9HYPH|nr:hypothetical protein [Rhizobium lemnae]MCJ8509256.1 hypothetical protein [Rhizobium lemnae]